ncbi:MAG: EAL domain-containing protein [Butyrivibrio sp.]|nr:EAL domain-containing protein [Butyrivibrio sp.]
MFLSYILLALNPVFAQDDIPVVKVGFIDTKGFLSKDQNGFSGVFYDYLENLKNYAQVKFVYESCIADNCTHFLDNGKLDVIANVVPGKDLTTNQYLSFSKAPVFNASIVLIAHEDVSNSHRLLQIGYPISLTGEELVKRALDKYGLSLGLDYTLLPFVSSSSMYEAFNKSHIDAVLTTNTEHAVNGVIIAKLYDTGCYFAVKKGNEGLLYRLNESAEEMKLFNKTLIPQLLDKNVINNEQINKALILTEEEKQYIKDHPVIRAAFIGDEPPYSYMGKDGEHKGMIADIANELIEELGIKLECVDVKNQRVLNELFDAGKIDIIADAWCDYSWAEAKNAALTFPYLNASFVQVTRNNYREKGMPKVAAIAGNRNMQQQIKRLLPHAELVFFNDYLQCMNAVSVGIADVTFIRAVSVQRFIEDNNLYDLKVNPAMMFYMPVSIAVSKNNKLILVRILNKAISYQWISSIDRKFNSSAAGFQSPHSLQSFLFHYYGYIISVVALVLLLVIVVLGMYLSVRRKSMARIKALAYSDSITGLPNLHSFEEKLPRYLMHLMPRLRSGSVFIMTVKVRALEELVALYSNAYVQNILVQIVYKLIKDMQYVKRYGVSIEYNAMYALGIVPDNVDLQKHLEEFCKRYTRESPIRIRFVMGVRLLSKDDEAVGSRTFIDHALLALRIASEQNKTVVFYNNKAKDLINREKEIEDLMNKALVHDEYKMWLQPKYDINTHKLKAAEALVRWDSPDMGFFGPGEFINLFEHNGFILELDYYILTKAFEFQKRRLEAGLPIVPISVNQSGLHMAENGYVERMRKIVEKYGSPKGVIELEITETALVDYSTNTAKNKSLAIVEELKSLDFDISMDDFCTGYSSIAMLETFPIDEIKIDRVMLVSSEDSIKARKIMQSVINLGHELKIRVICEGIETQNQEKLLLSLGCTVGQGFIYAKPMPMERFDEFIAENI